MEYSYLFVWVFFAWLITRGVDVTKPEYVLGQERYRWRKVPAFLLFLPIFLLASVGDPRFDTFLYLSIYDSLPTGLGALWDAFSSENKGPAFTALGILIKTIFGPNQVYYRLILAAIHAIPIVLIYRKYSEDYLTSIYLFLATGVHLAWMMNGIRQFVAVVIIFSTTPWLLQKKYLPSLIAIAVAYFFHSSAIIMVPIIFVVTGKAFNKKTLFFIMLTLIATYAFANFTGLLDRLLEGTEYSGTMESMRAYGDDGANPLRIVISAVPAIVALIGRKDIEAESDPMVNLCINMSIISAGLFAISAVTSGITVGRLPIYTNLYAQILLPYVVRKTVKGRAASMAYLAMIVLYFIYSRF